MDTNQQIGLFKEFIENNYHSELMDKVSKGENFLIIDFILLSKFDPDLAQDILDQPSETIKAVEIAISQFDALGDIKFRVRISGLPESIRVNIGHIRGVHIGKFIKINGIVGQKSDVRPQVVSARFECPSCGTIISVLQLDSNFKTPNNCSCGRKGKFRLISKELVDAQGIVLEESPEELEGGEQPKRLNVFLKDDLVSPLSEKKTNPGSKVQICGILKDIPIVQYGVKLTRLDLILEANYIETLEEDFSDINISEEDEKQIIKLSQNPDIFRMMCESVTPATFGHEKIKEALTLQLFGGVRKKGKKGAILRGDIHILLIGDPGTSKSQILKQIAKLAPKSRYGAGKGISGPGLTAAVVKDEFLKGNTLEAGLLVLANRGICCIDELGNISPEHLDSLREPMEQQTVTIAKANIRTQLNAQTSILAAANPKFGRFDPYELIAKQINMPPPLISRFDQIFVLRDIPNKDKDRKLAKFILNIHKEEGNYTVPIAEELFRKYIAYAKRKIKPKLSEEANKELEDFYVSMRNSTNTEESQAIPISARQMEALIRLTEASAKSRLSQTAYKSDAKKAIDLFSFCLNKVGIDPKTGKLDMDTINLGQSSSSRNNLFVIKNAMRELEQTEGKIYPEDSLFKMIKERMTRDEMEEGIEKLRHAGELFSPKRHFLQLMS